MRIAREEIFGPVLTVIPYTGDDEAIAIADDTDYGLSGSDWSSDPDRALAVARRIRSGSFGINQAYSMDPPSRPSAESRPAASAARVWPDY
jgi:acyl-CoA reductase-like NAD-dependent aldehyde dehydrogenase